MKEWNWIGNYSAHRALLSPDKTAVKDLDGSIDYSFKDLDQRADALAAGLQSRCGIEKGDRVAFLSRNCIELFDAYYATGKLGAILVPYNLRLAAGELTALVLQEEPKLLFFEEAFRPVVEKLKKETEIRHYVAVSGTEAGAGELSYESLLSDKGQKMLCGDLDMEDIHLLLHTGGTTGLPKAAMLSHRAMLFNAMSEIVTWNVGGDDSAYLLLPLFHTGGWNLLTLPLLHAGGCVMIKRQFDPADALTIIQDEKPSFIFGAATIFRMLAKQEGFQRCDFSSVRWMMAGAAPTPVEIMEQYWQKGVRFVLGYGMTEAGPNNLSVLAEDIEFKEMREKAGSVGKPFYFTGAKIVDDDDNELPPGEAGELIWNGPQIFSGYWKNPEETKKTLRNGWVYSGDMAKMDKDGYYYIVGRKKNMYISGGENVFPPEIESVLYRRQEINEVCVVGVADKQWGEVGMAVISLKENKELSEAELKSWLKQEIAHYKVPKYYRFVEDLPKSNVGKILRSEVAKQYGTAVEQNY